MKQSLCILLYIGLSIRANFMVFEPLMLMLLNFKSYIINQKINFTFILGCGNGKGHTSLYLKIGCWFGLVGLVWFGRYAKM